MAETDYSLAFLTAALLKLGDIPAYANVYVALHSSDPGASGNYGTETVGTGYGRRNLEVTAAPHSNVNELTWVVGSAWSDVTHISIGDSSQGGNMLLYESITTITGPSAGVIIKIPIGNLTIN